MDRLQDGEEPTRVQPGESPNVPKRQLKRIQGHGVSGVGFGIPRRRSSCLAANRTPQKRQCSNGDRKRLAQGGSERKIQPDGLAPRQGKMEHLSALGQWASRDGADISLRQNSGVVFARPMDRDHELFLCPRIPTFVMEVIRH